MASPSGALDALAQVEQVLTEYFSAVEAKTAEMRAEIAALKDALAAGSDAQPVFDGIERRLQQITSLTHSARARL